VIEDNLSRLQKAILQETHARALGRGEIVGRGKSATDRADRSRAIRRLEARGLVVRERAHGRTARVCLTGRGREIVEGWAQEIEDLRALAQRLEQERAQEQARQIEEIRARNAAYLARPAGRRHAARLMRAAFPYVHLNWEAVFALGTGGRVRSRRKRFHL